MKTGDGGGGELVGVGGDFFGGNDGRGDCPGDDCGGDNWTKGGGEPIGGGGE